MFGKVISILELEHHSIFRISSSGVTSNPWYTVIIYKGDNLVCRDDKRSLEEAKDACESFLKHAHYRNR